MKKPNPRPITYADLHKRLSKIDALLFKSKLFDRLAQIEADPVKDQAERRVRFKTLLPDYESILKKVKAYLDWTKENYHRMDHQAKAAVRSELHLETELIITKALNLMNPRQASSVPG